MLSSHGGTGNEEGVKVGENEATDQRKSNTVERWQ